METGLVFCGTNAWKADRITTVQAIFDELFDLFWSGFYDNLREAFGQATGGLEALDSRTRRISPVPVSLP